MDHIYISDNKDLNNYGKISYGVSNHDIVYYSKKRYNEAQKKDCSFTCRSLKNYKYEELDAALNEISWQDFYNALSTTNCWEILYNKYLTCLNKLAPFVIIKPKKQKDECVTSELLDLIGKRDYHKERADSLLKNNDYKEFKSFRNKAKRCIIISKCNYLNSKLMETDKNSKKYWRELGQICPISKNANKNSTDSISLKNIHGEKMDEPCNPNEFNKFFSTIGSELASLMNIDNSEYLEHCKQEPDYDLMYEWTEIRESEVETIVKNMDVSKNSNIEFINTKLLKDCYKITTRQLTYLFDMICKECIIPTSLKEALVIPLFKDGDKFSTSNYRPISLYQILLKSLRNSYTVDFISILIRINFVHQIREVLDRKWELTIQ